MNRFDPDTLARIRAEVAPDVPIAECDCVAAEVLRLDAAGRIGAPEAVLRAWLRRRQTRAVANADAVRRAGARRRHDTLRRRALYARWEREAVPMPAHLREVLERMFADNPSTPKDERDGLGLNP
jgi:hypothetical protein